jgi:hypothetical protein
LVPAIALAEVSPGPFPNCQTMFPARSISITRLLNWSVIRIFPAWLNPEFVVDPTPARTGAIVYPPTDPVARTINSKTTNSLAKNVSR